MSQTQDKGTLTHNGKTVPYNTFSKLVGEALQDKLTSGSEEKYISVYEIVQENELEYDSLNLFSRLAPSLLRSGAKDLINLVLTKAPAFDPLDPHAFIKSFGAYQDFCMNLLSNDCSYIIDVTEYVLKEALKLCTIGVTDQITIKLSDSVFESIEDIQKRARELLQGSKKGKLVQIKNHRDEGFLTELFKTHPNAHEKGILSPGATLKVFKGKSQQNTACFFISTCNDQETLRSTPSQDEEKASMKDISYMKCVNEVAVKLSRNMVSAMEELRLDVRMLIDLAVTIADRFPFNKPKILALILKMIPHAALHVQLHAIYIRILFYILKKMPYYEEEILEAVLTRFIQIDVSIKSKQLAYKSHFTSQDLKADVYLFYLIQHFKNRLRIIEEDSTPSLQKKNLTNSADQKMDEESDDDSVLESSDEEETYDDSTLAKNKIDRFCDMLIRLFENNVLPYSESHYPQYCFLYVCSVNQMFLQKLITLFIVRAFSTTKVHARNYRSDQIQQKICNINYLCSLLATCGKGIISPQIFLDSIRFLVKFFKRKFHSKLNHEKFETHSSSSDCSDLSRIGKRKIKVDDKLFYISVVQGLSYIVCFKIPEIESQDPSLLVKILKLILNNEHKAALFNQTSLLETLQSSLKTHRVPPKYIRRLTKLMKEQKNFLRYKKDLFNRIKRKMPFGTPLFLNESGVFFSNIHSHLPNNQIQESITKSLIPPEMKKGYLEKKPVVDKPAKESGFEDKQLNSAMIAAFGQPKSMVEMHKSSNVANIRKIFGKLGRSLSVDFKHKQNASSHNQEQEKSKFSKEGFVRTLKFDGDGEGKPHFELNEDNLAQIENLSDGYASDKNTDVASIDLLDRVRPWMHRRKNRSRNRNRRINRMKANLMSNQ